MKNDKRIAAIADKILRQVPMEGEVTVYYMDPTYGRAYVSFDKLNWRDIRDVAAAYLATVPSTQVQKALAGQLGTHRAPKRMTDTAETVIMKVKQAQRIMNRLSVSPFYPSAKPKRSSP